MVETYECQCGNRHFLVIGGAFGLIQCDKCRIRYRMTLPAVTGGAPRMPPNARDFNLFMRKEGEFPPCR